MACITFSSFSRFSQAINSGGGHLLKSSVLKLPSFHHATVLAQHYAAGIIFCVRLTPHISFLFLRRQKSMVAKVDENDCLLKPVKNAKISLDRRILQGADEPNKYKIQDINPPRGTPVVSIMCKQGKTKPILIP